MLFDREFADFLDQYIEKKIKNIIQIEMKKYGNMRGWSAKVVSINADGTINVILSGDSKTVPNLKNKSGQTLSVNDEVFLFSISDLTNAFIGVKK